MMLCHQVAHKATTGMLPAEGQDVSHLCSNPACFNPAHLVIEDHCTNMSRQRCLGTVKGLLPCPCCNVEHAFTKVVCTHEPKCMIVTNV